MLLLLANTFLKIFTSWFNIFEQKNFFFFVFCSSNSWVLAQAQDRMNSEQRCQCQFQAFFFSCKHLDCFYKQPYWCCTLLGRYKFVHLLESWNHFFEGVHICIYQENANVFEIAPNFQAFLQLGKLMWNHYRGQSSCEMCAAVKIYLFANSAQTEYCTTFLCVLVTGVTSQVFSIIWLFRPWKPYALTNLITRTTLNTQVTLTTWTT